MKMTMCNRKNGGMSVMILVITFLTFPDDINGDRTFTKVYETLPSNTTMACFKRLNGTHEIGCRSSATGDVGVLHLVEDDASLAWVLKDGPHDPYIAMMYPKFFTKANILKFKNSDRVSGVLLLKENGTETTSAKAFTHDSTCPNAGFGIYNPKSDPEKFCPVWNEPGSSLLFENFDFPIFYIRSDPETNYIVKCYENFNKPVNGTARDWPLCAAQLKAFMLAAVDTPTCVRRSNAFSINPGTSKVCDPLGDQNLLASIRSANETAEVTYANDSVIVIATRLDGGSLFDEMSPSADTSVSGLVTVLAIVKHLGSIKDQLADFTKSKIENVFFMIFNGESFGYIGSSRVVYGMKKGEIPLKIEQIRYFIEINQAALRNDESYYIHQSERAQSKELTDFLIDEGKSLKLDLKVVSNNNRGLPPASLHSFLKGRPNLKGLVITNHETVYRNQFYNSIYDDKEKMEYTYKNTNSSSVQQKIASLAATVANSVIKLLNPADPVTKIEPDLETVDELLHCYLEAAECQIFKDISGGAGRTSYKSYPTYVGVSMHVNPLTFATNKILITYLESSVENVTKQAACGNKRWWINGTCWENEHVNMSEATSPAFIIEDYDWASGKYSTWTESVWQKLSVRVFLKPSLLHEVLTLVSGIVVMIVSLVLVRIVNAKADSIFQNRYTGYLPVPPD